MNRIKYTFLLTALTLISCSKGKSQSLSNKQLVSIQNKLDNVKVGQYLDYKSWLITSEKDTISFEKFKSKWVLIDFWSTGCIPCVKEFPYIEKFYKKNKDKIEVIAVSVDNDFRRYLRGYKKYNLEISNFYGGNSYSNPIFALNIQKYIDKDEKNAGKFGTFIPQYVLISPKGIIRDKNIPKPSSEAFKKKMNNYLDLD